MIAETRFLGHKTNDDGAGDRSILVNWYYLKLGPGENCCFDILTREGVFEEALNVLAIVSSIDVADGELVNFQGEFCFPCRSIDVPAVELPQVLLAAAAF